MTEKPNSVFEEQKYIVWDLFLVIADQVGDKAEEHYKKAEKYHAAMESLNYAAAVFSDVHECDIPSFKKIVQDIAKRHGVEIPVNFRDPSPKNEIKRAKRECAVSKDF